VQQHVGPGRADTVGHVPEHPRAQWSRMKSQCIQGRFEQEVLLEAIAPSPRLHHLVLKRFEIQSDGMSKKRGKILERDRFDVPAVQHPKRIHRGGSTAFVTDSLQIGFEIERFHATFNADQPALLLGAEESCADQTLRAMIVSGRVPIPGFRFSGNYSADPCHDSYWGSRTAYITNGFTVAFPLISIRRTRRRPADDSARNLECILRDSAAPADSCR
jgi:hypothetical protein